MARASEQILSWLRKLLDKRGVNTAELAERTGLARPHLRKVLTGAEPMLVDELLAITNTLQISPADVGLGASMTVEDEAPVHRPFTSVRGRGSAARVEGPPEEPPVTIDPWGNQPEQLLRAGFALGCDLLFLADTAQLEGSGVPAPVLQQYAGQEVPIRLDPAYHRHNAPRYSEQGVTLTLSFDSLHDCTFPWPSIRRVVFFPALPEPVKEPEPAPRGRPKLRIVE